MIEVRLTVKADLERYERILVRVQKILTLLILLFTFVKDSVPFGS